MTSIIRDALLSQKISGHKHNDPTGKVSISVGQKAANRYDELIDKMNAAREAGQITNPDYKELKEGINRRIEEAWDSLFFTFFIDQELNTFSEADQQAIRDASYSSDIQLHTFNSKMKRVDKVPDTYSRKTLMLEFLQEFKPIVDTMNFLKDNIIKRVAKPVEDVRAKYLAPMASMSAMAQVQTVLNDLTGEAFGGIRDQFLASFKTKIAYYEKEITAAKAAGKKTPRIYDVFIANKNHPDHEGQHLCSMVFDIRGQKYEDADSKLLAEATSRAEFIRDEFVIKNLKKFGSIIETKGNFKSVKVVGQSLDIGSLIGTLLVKFEDGSSFYAHNSVVWSYSKYQKAFVRYPLTFSGVVLPDGTHMSNPSEERMNTIFAVAEA